jgi:GNAT superfamily N-acetyltransferase
MNDIEQHNGDYVISTDPARLDRGLIHAWLNQNSYWAKGVAREIVERAIDHSLCFGIYQGARQVGFARAVTDRATFAWLADVFVLEAHRARGLSKWLMQTILAHPELQGLRRWLLGTRDAHGLYAQSGFQPLAHPERFMELHRPNIYNAPSCC